MNTGKRHKAGVFSLFSGLKTDAVQKYKPAYFAAAIFVLACGIAIYGTYRNLDILFFQIIQKPAVLEGFQTKADIQNPLTAMLVFNLPDGLWFLSGLLFIRAIWLNHKKWRVIYFAGFSAAAASLEICQIFENIPGTFDILDLFFMGIMAFLESLVYTKFISRSLLLRYSSAAEPDTISVTSCVISACLMQL